MNKSFIKERDKHRLNYMKHHHHHHPQQPQHQQKKKTIETPAILSIEGFQIDDQTISTQVTHGSLLKTRRQREPSLVVQQW